MTIEIEKNIPIPKGRIINRSDLYDVLEKMDIGDSIKINVQEPKYSGRVASNAMNTVRISSGKSVKFKSMMVSPNERRIWRIE